MVTFKDEIIVTQVSHNRKIIGQMVECRLQVPGFPINILVVGGAPCLGNGAGNQRLVREAVCVSLCQQTGI